MSSVRENCEYEDDVKNLETRENLHYQCPRQARASGLCELHEPGFLTEQTAVQVSQIFMQEIIRFVRDRQPIICVGYHLPTIELENFEFSESVSFVNLIIDGTCNFSNAKFLNKVDFSRFTCGDDFILTDVEFNEEVNFFKFTQNHGISNFQGAIFHEEVKFFDATIQDGLFTICKFDEVNFKKATFNGPTEFRESDFNNKCDFTETVFNGNVDFYHRDIFWISPFFFYRNQNSKCLVLFLFQHYRFSHQSVFSMGDDVQENLCWILIHKRLLIMLT